MKMTKDWGMLLLGIWLVLLGLRSLLNLGYSPLNLLIDVLALAAGALILWSIWAGKAASA